VHYPRFTLQDSEHRGTEKTQMLSSQVRYPIKEMKWIRGP